MEQSILIMNPVFFPQSFARGPSVSSTDQVDGRCQPSPLLVHSRRKTQTEQLRKLVL